MISYHVEFLLPLLLVMHKFPSSPHPRPALTEDKLYRVIFMLPNPHTMVRNWTICHICTPRLLHALQCGIYMTLHLELLKSLLIRSSPTASTCVSPSDPAGA